jgi:hypothetical protein
MDKKAAKAKFMEMIAKKNAKKGGKKGLGVCKECKKGEKDCKCKKKK